MKQHAEEGNALGLSDEEQAFYDALTRPRAVKDFYENNQLVAMAREITDALRKNRTLDWRQKETARAKANDDKTSSKEVPLSTRRSTKCY